MPRPARLLEIGAGALIVPAVQIYAAKWNGGSIQDAFSGLAQQLAKNRRPSLGLLTQRGGVVDEQARFA